MGLLAQALKLKACGSLGLCNGLGQGLAGLGRLSVGMGQPHGLHDAQRAQHNAPGAERVGDDLRGPDHASRPALSTATLMGGNGAASGTGTPAGQR